MKKLLAILCLGLTLPATAEMYKWVDENGQVHYSEKRPSGSTQFEKVKPPAAPSAGVSMGTEAPTDTQIEVPGSWNDLKEEKVGQEEKDWATQEIENQEKARTEKAEREVRCNQAKGRLASLQQTNRMYTTDANGERTYLSDEERQTEIAGAQAAVDKECG